MAIDLRMNEVQTAKKSTNEGVLQNDAFRMDNEREIKGVYMDFERVVCKNSILQDETVKRNKTNVLRLLDDIKIDCNVTLELLPFDNDKRIFRVNESAKSESEKYTFLFSAKKYSDLFLLLQGFIIGLTN